MTYGITDPEWRSKVRADDLDHYEHVWAREQEMARRAAAAGVTYRDIPWHEARNDRSLIGKRVTRAYWIGGGDLPWGHQHAHGFAFAFEPVINIGADFIALETRGSEHLISYDTICVQEPITA